MENDYQLDMYGLRKHHQLLDEIETAIKAEYDAYCKEDITSIHRIQEQQGR